MNVDKLFDLSGEVALITGASSGLGWRFAEVLAARGAHVIAAARRTDRLQTLKEQIIETGGKADVLALDVAEAETIPAAFDVAEAVAGTVTLLVNNAGISGQSMALKMSDDQWRNLMDINLDAVWRCSTEAARRMSGAEKPGAIINVASILGFRVSQSLSAYAIAKAGVVQMTRAHAIEFARHNIRVNAIAPGYIRTEINDAFFSTPAGEEMIKQIPQRRIGTPSDLDGTLLLLASREASGFMTGSTIVVDGGHMNGLG